MADAIITLGIDGKGAQAGGRVVKRSLDDVKGSAKTTENRFKSLTGSARKMGLLFGGGLGIAGLIAGMRSGIATSIQFGASISNLSAITGATGRDLAFLTEKSKEIGRTTSLSASQAATGFKLIASAKPDLLEAADALAAVTLQAVILSEAAGISLPASATALGNALNQFGEGAESASRFINVLAAGSKFGAAEIPLITAALRDSGTVANAAGISFEELVAQIEVLAAVGIKGARAGVGIRNVILKLQEGADETNPAIVGLSTALQTLGAQGLTTAQLIKKFGLENVVAAQNMINLVDETEELTLKLTGTDTAIEQARVNMDNLKGDTLELKSAFEALQIEIGEKGDSSLRTLTQSMRDLVNVLTDNVGAIVIVSKLIAGLLIAKVAAAAIRGLASAMIGSGGAVVGLRMMATVAPIAAARMALTGTAAGTAAVAVRGLKAALAFIGGPLGVAILAAGALALFATRTTEAEEATNKFIKSIKEETAELVKLREERKRGITETPEAEESLLGGLEKRRSRLNELIREKSLELGGRRSGTLRKLRIEARELNAVIQSIENSITKRDLARFRLNEGVDEPTESPDFGVAPPAVFKLSGSEVKSLAALRDQLIPLNKAQEEFAKGQALLGKAIDSGDVELSEAIVLNGLLTDSYRDVLDPLGAVTRELKQEGALLGLSRDARADATRVMDIENQLRQAGVDLSVSQKRELTGLVGAIRETAKAQDLVNQLNQDAKSILEAAQTPLERYQATYEKLSLALSEGRIRQDQFNDAVKDANIILEQQKKELDKNTESARRFGSVFTDAFEDAIIEGKSLLDILEGLDKELARAFLQEFGVTNQGGFIDSIVKDVAGTIKGIGKPEDDVGTAATKAAGGLGALETASKGVTDAMGTTAADTLTAATKTTILGLAEENATTAIFQLATAARVAAAALNSVGSSSSSSGIGSLLAGAIPGGSGPGEIFAGGNDLFQPFAGGGSGIVKGPPGVDNLIPRMRVSAGELIEVKTPAQQRQGGGINIFFQNTIFANTPDQLRRGMSQTTAQSANQAARILSKGERIS